MTGLNENHRRILFHRFEAIDHSLFELECELDPISLNSPFRGRIGGLTKAQRAVVKSFSKRLRTRMCEMLTQRDALIPPETVSVHRAVRPYLLAVELSLEELGYKHMKGYGDLSDSARLELEEIVAELQGLVAELEAKLNE
jgi:hypothetical protein